MRTLVVMASDRNWHEVWYECSTPFPAARTSPTDARAVYHTDPGTAVDPELVFDLLRFAKQDASLGVENQAAMSTSPTQIRTLTATAETRRPRTGRIGPRRVFSTWP